MITPSVPTRRIGFYLFNKVAASATAEAEALAQRTAAID
jgi:hypothetical protein